MKISEEKHDWEKIAKKFLLGFTISTIWYNVYLPFIIWSLHWMTCSNDWVCLFNTWKKFVDKWTDCLMFMHALIDTHLKKIIIGKTTDSVFWFQKKNFVKNCKE